MPIEPPDQASRSESANQYSDAEARGVEPVFPKKDQAINYARNRACFCSGKIRVLDSTGKLERTIPFSEADRNL